MTTEYAAILFTDVVGSTELSQRLSPDAADQMRRDHFAVLRQTLADARGIEVKNLGDGLMAVFSSASAALACGVAMQQAVGTGRIERSRREHAAQDNAERAADAMHAPHVERVVPAEPVLQRDRVEADQTRNDADDAGGGRSRRRCRGPACAGPRA